ncbi:21066_t:CDS:2, partial [Rhizophagus irregularis]
LPGCNTHSVGFHSDEGRRYTGSKYDEKWVNKYLGIAYIGLFYTWYPSIGSNCVCSLKVNFGQDEFKYKETGGMGITGIISHEADDIFTVT